MTTHKIVIEPNTHNGWTLEFSASHDGKSGYRGHKGPRSVFAPDLPRLIAECDKADAVTVRLRHPFAVLHDDGYSRSGHQKCRITLLCGERFVYINQKGETHEGLLHWLRLDDDNNERGRWLLDNADNRKIQKRIAALEEEERRLGEAIRAQRRKLAPLTKADVLVAAGQGGN